MERQIQRTRRKTKNMAAATTVTATVRIPIQINQILLELAEKSGGEETRNTLVNAALAEKYGHKHSSF